MNHQYPLLQHHIHLWQISLNPDISELQQVNYYQTLPLDEQTRADQFIFEKHRRRFIVAHYALRKILSEYISVLPEHIIFDVMAQGKPEISIQQNPDNICFNLSHSGETALVGLRTEKTIGVDIEYHRDREIMGIASHVFSDNERAQLYAMSESERVAGFFHIWAQKEAFIKAIGQGLYYPLKDFTVSATPPARLIEAYHENIVDWYLHGFQPNQQAHAAIATLLPVTHMDYFLFN